MKKVLFRVLPLFMMVCFQWQAIAQDFMIESIKVEQDGSLTVRVWGNGRNKADAKELARKNAVYAVIFDGVQTGVAKNQYTRPLLPQANARTKSGNREYFDKFFTDGGQYQKYASGIDTRARSNVIEKEQIQVRFCTTVRVLVPQLRQRLVDDGLLLRNDRFDFD